MTWDVLSSAKPAPFPIALLNRADARLLQTTRSVSGIEIAENHNVISECAFLGASQRSAIERRHNEQPGTDQQGKADTTNDRENAMSANGRFGSGNGSLRRCDAHPKVTHISDTSMPVFASPAHGAQFRDDIACSEATH
jgi:hypothetical protein